MLSRRLLARANCLPRTLTPIRSTTIPHNRQFSTIRPLRTEAEDLDQDINGGYVNPTNHPYPLKRQFRDPYYPWSDKQERRNFGEPVHEDNDILGMFSLHEYTHMSAGRAWALWVPVVGTFLGLCYVVQQFYPDMPSVPREFPDGLEAELGGPHALRARKEGDEI